MVSSGKKSHLSAGFSSEMSGGKRHVSARVGFVIDFHDTIEHPVGWRFAGLRSVTLYVGDGIAKERELSVAWALRQDDEPRVQLGVRARCQEIVYNRRPREANEPGSYEMSSSISAPASPDWRTTR